VRVKIAANSAHASDAVMLTICKSPPRRLEPEQLRLFIGFDAAPELTLGRDNQMLIERIGMGENREKTGSATGAATTRAST
jgi:hypothetical protein